MFYLSRQPIVQLKIFSQENLSRLIYIENKRFFIFFNHTWFPSPFETKTNYSSDESPSSFARKIILHY